MSRTVALLLLAYSLPALAQESFIVRLHDGAPSPLVTALESPTPGKRGAYATLFSGIASVAPVFRGSHVAPREPGPIRAYTLMVDDEERMEAVMEAWRGLAGVAYVQRNHRYRIETSPSVDDGFDDPLLDSLQHLAVVGAFEAWRRTTGSPEVRIGFVDTGVYRKHPDLIEQLWVNQGEDINRDGRWDQADINGSDDDGNGFVDDGWGYDFVDQPFAVEVGDYRGRDPDPSEDGRSGGGRGHGTVVAGVLAAQLDNGEGVAGMAPGCRLVPLRAFGADGLGEDDDIVAAILYAAQMGVDVLNLSFGDVYYSPLMREAIAYAVQQGTVVVASAGNLGGDDPHYPSDYPEVISVSWLDAEGTGLAGRATHGTRVDLGAPGSFIMSTLMPEGGEPAGYGRRSGSSLAAPMVSGAAALLRSISPDLSAASIRSILTGTAVDIDQPGWDHRTGAGRLDVATALLRALPARVELLRPDHSAGVASDEVVVVGTAVDPAFDSYVLEYTEGDVDPGATWTRISGPEDRQVYADTLARWNVAALPDGVYTLRLAVRLRTGQTVEDRRRLFIDRTPPVVRVRVLEDGLVHGKRGIVVDLETDDLTTVLMDVEGGGRLRTITSEKRARRHGLVWADDSGNGGDLTATLRVTNAAGLVSTYTKSLTLGSDTRNPSLLREHLLDVPQGFLLPASVDFDRDDLRELVFNRYEDGWVGDTLAFYEWAGDGFRPAFALLAGVIPRDVGDTDGDGSLELLTQVTGATLLLEQESPTTFPARTAFIDTTGLANPFDPNAAFGARLVDLDGDGRGEVLVHNTSAWRVLEYTSGTYTEVARLENPTSVGMGEIDQNEFSQPVVLVADLDGDGRQNLLAGDGDGDWIMYEARGNDAFEVVWTYETDRYNAGTRFVSGDLDGDGRLEFVTYTQNWTQPTRDGEREPDIGLYHVWDVGENDDYVLVDVIPVAGRVSRHGALAVTDLEPDGRDELVVVHAPDLYVMGFDESLELNLRFHRGADASASGLGMRSTAVVVADFDGDGFDELVAAGADGRMHRFVYDAAGDRHPAPRWKAAHALDASHVLLAWEAHLLDSVSVYAAAPEGSYDLVATFHGDSALVVSNVERSYVLRGWYGSTPSPLSEARRVRPHHPAVVDRVSQPDPRSIAIVFSEPLQPDTRPEQFALDRYGSARRILLNSPGRTVVLRFSSELAGIDTLRWQGVRDVEGTPVAQHEVPVVLSSDPLRTLIIETWQILGPYMLEVGFNEPLDSSYAVDATNYRLEPTGRIVKAVWDGRNPSRVILHVDGVPVGATGLQTSLVVVRMQSAAGSRIADEGTAILLSEPATELTGAYVYPNPYREGRHQPRVVIAGLPREATVHVVSVHGEPVRRLLERRGNGGVEWDLRDEHGTLVPSGLYLVRVEAPGSRPVLLKAVVIR